MSIRSKFIIACSIVLGLAAGVAIYGIQAISDASGLVVRLYDEPFMAVSHARAAQARFSDARAAMDGALFRKSRPRSDVALLESAMNDVREDLEVVRRRMTLTDSASLVASAQALARDWYEIGLKLVSSDGEALSDEREATVTGKATAAAEAIDQVVEAASAFGFQFRSAAEAELVKSRINLIVMAAAAGLLGILFSITGAFSFGRPVRRAMAIAERIAGGDFSVEISSSRRDELGRLLDSLGAMQTALRDQVAAGRLDAERKETERRIQTERRRQIEGEIGQFRSTVGDTLLEVDEMTSLLNATASGLSAIATKADREANDAARAAEKTSSNVTVVATAMAQLSQTVQEIAGELADVGSEFGQATAMARNANDLIASLSDATKHIDSVVGLIRSIAKQTNLLALNATIESARAGEAGRGFAVVASEVRTLATQTAKATEEVSAQISAVQSSAGQAVDAIRSIASIMTEINGVILRLGAAVQQQNITTGEISRNVQGAATGTQDVARNVTSTSAVIGDTSHSAIEVLKAAETLTTHAKTLRASVAEFLNRVAAA